MFEVVLYQPQIPPNTGNVIRLCANSGCCLHLIAPLGFDLTDRQLRRAGLDYHEYARLCVHPSLTAMLASLGQDRRVLAFSARATRRYDAPAYAAGDVLLFGPESSGLPESVLAELPADQRLRLPMRRRSRSLNLSNAVAVVVYEAWRQHDFAGAG